MTYRLDMSKEDMPKDVIAEGWYEVQVTNGNHTFSSSGNEMFVWSLYFPELDFTMKVYTVNIKGKRWLMKQLMETVVEKDENGHFIFESEETWRENFIQKACGQTVRAKVVVKEEEYKGRLVKKNTIASFKKVGEK